LVVVQLRREHRLYLNFGALAGSWSLSLWKCIGSKFGSIGFFDKHEIPDRQSTTIYCNFGTLAGLESRPQTQCNLCAETFPTNFLNMITGTQVIQEKTNFSW
jgi:hypothetical protein